MQYMLILSYWNDKDENCGCDVWSGVPLMLPEDVQLFPILAPAETVHMVASLESLIDASLLWVSGYEMGEHGKEQ